jgi:hypothetical protein
MRLAPHVVVAIMVAASLASATQPAQAIDFSGKWRVNPTAGNPPSQSSNEQIWDIAQTATELRLRVVVNGREVSLHTWPLGGPPISARRDGLESTTTATVGNGELVIAGKGTSGTGAEMDIREQWVIDPSTNTLRVAKVNSTVATSFTRQLVLERVADR